MYKNNSLTPRSLPCLIALLKTLLKTYPLPSFDGITPSFTRKVTALEWSAITFNEKSFLGSSPYFTPEILPISSIIGNNKSVSKLFGFPCTTAVILSSPAPVSMFFLGRGSRCPSSILFHSVKTKFQISMKRLSVSGSPSLEFSSPPNFTPRSTYISEHGPQEPVGPAAHQLSSSPNLTILSLGKLHSETQSSSASSSVSKTLTHNLSFSIFKTSVINS